MSAKQFLIDDFRKNVALKNIDLVNDTIKAALCNEFSPSYSAWASGTSYSEGSIVVPTTRNGLRYRATNDGTSGSSEPTWPTTSGETVTDNGVTWEEYGGEHADNEFWDDVSANELSEDGGYTAGGETLGSKTVAKDSIDPITTEWDADNTVWSELDKTMRYAFLYVAGDTPGTNDFLISYILLDDTPADVTINGVKFTLEWDASGILGLTRKV